MQELLGHHVKELWMNPEQDKLCFVVATGQYNNDRAKFTYRTDGDCCSCSYFQDIIGVDSILDEKINAIESHDMPEKWVGDRQEELHQFYKETLKTDMGRCDIVYRNESNGYYGGWHKICESPTDQELKSWNRITEDVG